jgi:hypothetical protein
MDACVHGTMGDLDVRLSSGSSKVRRFNIVLGTAQSGAGTVPAQAAGNEGQVSTSRCNSQVDAPIVASSGVTGFPARLNNVSHDHEFTI